MPSKEVEQEMLNEAADRLNKLTGGSIRVYGTSRGYTAMGEGGPIGTSAGEVRSFGVMHKCLLFAQHAMRDAELTKRRQREREEREKVHIDNTKAL